MRLMEYGPAVMVPAAWVLAGSAVASLVTRRTVLIALVVMTALLVAFLLGSRGEMDGPVLGVWQTVLVAGLVATAAGTVGLALTPPVDALVSLSLYAWVLLPAGAYVRSYTVAPDLPALYLAAGALSALGGVVMLASEFVGALPADGLFVGLALVGVGQTAGILDAVVRY